MVLNICKTGDRHLPLRVAGMVVPRGYSHPATCHRLAVLCFLVKLIDIDNLRQGFRQRETLKLILGGTQSGLVLCFWLCLVFYLVLFPPNSLQVVYIYSCSTLNSLSSCKGAVPMLVDLTERFVLLCIFSAEEDVHALAQLQKAIDGLDIQLG